MCSVVSRGTTFHCRISGFSRSRQAPGRIRCPSRYLHFHACFTHPWYRTPPRRPARVASFSFITLTCSLVQVMGSLFMIYGGMANNIPLEDTWWVGRRCCLPALCCACSLWLSISDGRVCVCVCVCRCVCRVYNMVEQTWEEEHNTDVYPFARVGPHADMHLFLLLLLLFYSCHCC